MHLLRVADGPAGCAHSDTLLLIHRAFPPLSGSTRHLRARAGRCSWTATTPAATAYTTRSAGRPATSAARRRSAATPRAPSARRCTCAATRTPAPAGSPAREGVAESGRPSHSRSQCLRVASTRVACIRVTRKARRKQRARGAAARPGPAWSRGGAGAGRLLRRLPVHALRREHHGAGPGLDLPALPRPVQLQLPPHPPRLGAHGHAVPPRAGRGCARAPRRPPPWRDAPSARRACLSCTGVPGGRVEAGLSASLVVGRTAGKRAVSAWW